MTHICVYVVRINTVATDAVSKIDAGLVKLKNSFICHVNISLLRVVVHDFATEEPICVPLCPVTVRILHGSSVEVAQDDGTSLLHRYCQKPICILSILDGGYC